MKIKALINIPHYTTFALVNHKAKRIVLFHSTNTLVSLIRIIEKITNKQFKDKHLVQYRHNYEFEILEVFHNLHLADELTLQMNKYSLYFFEEKYRELGYTVSKPLNALKYRFETALVAEGDVQLDLVNKSGSRFKCGIFANIQECNQFLEYIKHKPIHVIALNALTKQYYLNRK